MKSLIIILLGLSISWYFTDLSSDSSRQNMLAPIGVIMFLISFAIWLVLKAGFGTKANRSGGFFGGDGGFDGDGGD
jgi:hypothetical protein